MTLTPKRKVLFRREHSLIMKGPDSCPPFAQTVPQHAPPPAGPGGGPSSRSRYFYLYIHLIGSIQKKIQVPIIFSLRGENNRGNWGEMFPLYANACFSLCWVAGVVVRCVFLLWLFFTGYFVFCGLLTPVNPHQRSTQIRVASPTARSPPPPEIRVAHRRHTRRQARPRAAWVIQCVVFFCEVCSEWFPQHIPVQKLISEKNQFHPSTVR